MKNDTNTTKKTKKPKNKDNNITKKDLIKKHLKAQMAKEAKYAKEKTFYTGKDYDLKSLEVDKESLKHIKSIEPDYDFEFDAF